MASSRGFAGVLGVTVTLFLANCSLQNFDYLKNEYPSHGGTGGTTASAGGAGGGGGTTGTGEGGSTATAGTSSSGAGKGGLSNGGTSAVGGDMGNADAGAAGAAEPPPGMLMNGGFEIGANGVSLVPGWTSTSKTPEAATVVFGDHPHSGSGRLGHWLMAGAYTVSTSQVVSPIPNGNYTFSAWSGHSQFLNDEYIFAKGYSKSQPAAQMKVSTMSAGDSSYTQFKIEHIPVTNGRIEVGVYTDGPNDSSENWAWIDDAELTLEPPP